MQIEVWSDIACPWCWLGKHHLEEALRRRGTDATVEFRSFELNVQRRPSVPAREYLVERFGSEAQVDEAQARLVALGREAGIAFDFQRGLVTNTFDAHRVHHLAKAEGKGPAVVEAFMRAYHGEGADLADPATLVRLATGAGLSEGDVRRVLSGDEFATNVRADQERGRAIGVRGVPFFVFDGRLAVSGAQPVEVFEEAIRQAASSG